MAQTPARTNCILARQVYDFVELAELVAWAVQALLDGFDAPSLRGLAALDLWKHPHELSLAEANEEFRRALRELGVAIPSPEEILRWHARELAKDIRAGRIDTETGVERMHSEVLSPLEYPKDLMNWCFLWEGLDPTTFRELSDAERDEQIRAAAERMASQDSA